MTRSTVTDSTGEITDTHTHTHRLTHRLTHTHTRTDSLTHSHTHTNTHTHVHIHICTRAHTHSCTRTHIDECLVWVSGCVGVWLSSSGLSAEVVSEGPQRDAAPQQTLPARPRSTEATRQHPKHSPVRSTHTHTQNT